MSKLTFPPSSLGYCTQPHETSDKKKLVKISEKKLCACAVAKTLGNERITLIVLHSNIHTSSHRKAVFTRATLTEAWWVCSLFTGRGKMVAKQPRPATC